MKQASNYALEETFDRKCLSDKEFTIKYFLKKYSEEEFIWIFIVLMSDQKWNIQQIEEKLIHLSNLDNIKKFISFELENQNNIREVLDKISYKKDNFFPIEHLENIKGDIVKILVVLNLLSSNLNTVSGIIIDSLNYRHYDEYLCLILVLYLEIHQNSIQKVLDIIYDARAFIEETVNFQTNLNKYIDDNNFIEWCYTYLQKNKENYIPQDYILIIPINIHEKRIYINTLINLYYIYSDQEKLKYIYLLNKIKKAWQVKIFRDKEKTKHKYHLPITHKAKDDLKKLAVFKNMTEGELLSELICKAFLNEMCDENGKIIY